MSQNWSENVKGISSLKGWLISFTVYIAENTPSPGLAFTVFSSVILLILDTKQHLNSLSLSFPFLRLELVEDQVELWLCSSPANLCINASHTVQLMYLGFMFNIW